MHTVTLGTTTLAFDDIGAGSGTPLLLVHGHPFDRSMWAPQIEGFRGAHRVIGPDLRGYGASPGAVPQWSAFADDLATLLDVLRVERAVVVGLSMGGQIAMDLQRRHPDRVAGLLLADTTAAVDADPAARVATADRLERDGMDPYAVEALYRMVRPDAPPRVAEHVLEMMRGTDPRGAAAAQRARAARPDYRSSLGAVDVPTVVVVGTEDDYTPIRDAQEIADRVPGAELVVIDGAAHLPPLEQPAAFNAAVARLLARTAAHAA
ncbi:alpha/beta fold hydrolase [Pseudonocardia sp. TRM90224]|uniref:alpha/beta fold hydrolase n=1 Tax=Pseudonocardia sp. TRM90224 TaxID=2812678 RepID=UPI001E50D54A|nr:alpha/beta fold hydrolase [Pseudonocardia sp. TRM90224]